jgi:hypothetical protein
MLSTVVCQFLGGLQPGRKDLMLSIVDKAVEYILAQPDGNIFRRITTARIKLTYLLAQ